MEVDIKTRIDGSLLKQCFRCGAPIHGFQDGGQVTISGFYSHKTLPYYSNFTLCETCHSVLTAKINEVMYSFD